MYKVNDWQDLSLKKNIDKILKAQGKSEAIGVALSFDIAIAVIVLCVDKGIDAINDATSCCFGLEKNLSFFEKLDVVYPFVILGMLGLIPSIIVGVRFFISRLAKRMTVAHIRSADELVDLFDNELCVYAMMAQSYADMLMTCNDASRKVFFYIQTCYYINKSISGLIKTQPQMTSIISDDSIELRTSKRISIDRVVNLVKVLIELIDSIKDTKIESSEDVGITKNMNSAKKEALEDYNKEINANFGKKLPTKIAEF